MDQFLELLNAAILSKSGTAVAALVLAGLVLLLQRLESVKKFFASSPALSKVSVLVVAVAPAVILSLTTKASWFDALMTAVLTGLGALGLDALKDPVLNFLKGLFKKS